MRVETMRVTRSVSKLIDVLIYDAQGKQSLHGTQPLNDFGTFSFGFDLDSEAALGGYSIQAQIRCVIRGGSADGAVLQRVTSSWPNIVGQVPKSL